MIRVVLRFYFIRCLLLFPAIRSVSDESCWLWLLISFFLRLLLRFFLSLLALILEPRPFTCEVESHLLRLFNSGSALSPFYDLLSLGLECLPVILSFLALLVPYNLVLFVGLSRVFVLLFLQCSHLSYERRLLLSIHL